MGRNQKRKRRSTWTVPILCILLVGIFAWWTYAQPFTSLRPTYSYKSVQTAMQSVSLTWPSYGEGAVGATGYGVLVRHGKQTALPTASIAKVMTALMVLRVRPLQLGESGPNITLTQADVDSYNKYIDQDGSVVGVSLGEQISEYQALEALLLPSANNMAETLARWAFGSIDAYNTAANSFAAELGLTSMRITDPSGFLPTTVASASDLTILGEQAMLNPVLAQIVALPSASIPVQGTVNNYNFLLGNEHNVGIKTGNNDQDPGAYLFAYKQTVGDSSVTVVGAIMGGPDLQTVLVSTKALASSIMPHFKQVTFVRKGDIIGTYHPINQAAAQAVASQSLSLIVWDGFSFTSTSNLEPLSGAINAGTIVGTLHVTNTASHAINSVPIVLNHTIRAESWRTRLAHPL